MGQYIGFVFDDSSCIATDTIDVITTGDPLITLDNITDVNCAQFTSVILSNVIRGSPVVITSMVSVAIQLLSSNTNPMY